MKSIISVVLLVVLSPWGLVNAESVEPKAEEPQAVEPKAIDPKLIESIELQRAKTEAERKAITVSSIPLSAEQASVFWPLYDSYRMDVHKVGNHYLAILFAFNDFYVDKDQEEGKGLQIVDAFLANKNARTLLKKKYLAAFAKVLNERQLVKFYQVDSKLDDIGNINLSKNIPLIELN